MPCYTKQNKDTKLNAYSKRRSSQLSVVSVQSTNIPPRELVTYAKQTQTVSSGHERDGEYGPVLLCVYCLDIWLICTCVF